VARVFGLRRPVAAKGVLAGQVCEPRDTIDRPALNVTLRGIIEQAVIYRPNGSIYFQRTNGVITELPSCGVVVPMFVSVIRLPKLSLYLANVASVGITHIVHP
jgi:hypothetical protein